MSDALKPNNDKRGPKFQVYKNTSNDFYHWRLVAANREELALSEPYRSKAAAVKGTESLTRAANDAEVIELDTPPRRERTAA